MARDAQNHSLVKKHKILVFGIIVFVVGIIFFGISWNFLDKMYLCENYNNARFLPNTTITVTCDVVGDVGQDLTLRSIFYSHGGVETIQIPAHLEIRNPNNIVLYDMDFDDKTIISFKLETHGTYTATITSLEDENNKIHKGSPQIVYALGFLTDYNDVYNPVGNTFVWLSPIGNVLFLFGIVLIIYGGIKVVRKKTIL